MKITFFKNESYFHPRISYTWENAETVSFDYGIQRLKKYSPWFFVPLLSVFSSFFSEKIISNYTFFIADTLLCLPLHELCHAIFAWISGRKIERICFFPYKQIFSSPTAYVKPAFGVWDKTQRILFSLFPILLLSIIPATLALFILAARVELLFISLFNFAVSSFDIVDILCLFKMPQKSLHFGDLILTAKEADKPIIIHQLFVTPTLDEIYHKCFQYYDNKLTEIDQVPESSEANKLRQEFAKQFNLER